MPISGKMTYMPLSVIEYPGSVFIFCGNLSKGLEFSKGSSD